MTTNAAGPTRRRRRWSTGRLAALGLIGVIVAALGILLHMAGDADRVAALLLSRTADATGLEWRTIGPAAIDWRPLPRLVLTDLEAWTADGHPLLRVRRAEVAVPWSALRGDAVAIESIRIDGLAIDGDRVAAWWDALPPTRPSPWPRLDHLTVADASWRQTGWQVDRGTLDLRGLSPGGHVVATAKARLRSPAEGPLADGIELIIALDATLGGDTAHPALENLDLRAGEPTDPDLLEVRGSIDLAAGWTAALEGRLSRWPDRLPALPAPLAAEAPIAFALTQQGDDPLRATTRLRLSTGGGRAEVEGRPDALRDWWDGKAGSEALPPLVGTVRAEALDLDGVRIEGLDIRMGETAVDPGRASPGPDQR